MSTIRERFKARQITSAQIQDLIGGLDESIVDIIRSKLRPGMTVDELMLEVETALSENIRKIVGAMANGTAKDLQLVAGRPLTKDEIQRISSWYVTRMRDNFASNTLWSYEKIKNKYGTTISIIRNSAMRDRLYLSDDGGYLKRFYLTGIQEIFGQNLTKDGTLKTSIRDVADHINGALHDLGKQRHGYTILNTQMLNVYSESNQATIDATGWDHGIYFGGLQARTRDFCADNLGKVLPWKEWQEMDNDLGDHDVTIHRGGYNCSHEVLPVDKADADEAQELLKEKYGDTKDERQETIDTLKEEKRKALEDAERGRRDEGLM